MDVEELPFPPFGLTRTHRLRIKPLSASHTRAADSTSVLRSKGSFAIPAMFEELTRLGYVEGRNLLIERYSGEGRAAHILNSRAR